MYFMTFLVTIHFLFEESMNNKRKNDMNENKAGYTATEVACGWAGAIFEVKRLFGREQ